MSRGLAVIIALLLVGIAPALAGEEPIDCPAGTKYKNHRQTHSCVRGDERHGSYLRLDEDGNERERGQYEAGKKHGTWVEYENGREHEITEYQNGRIHPTRTVFYASGQAEKIERYEQLRSGLTVPTVAEIKTAIIEAIYNAWCYGSGGSSELPIRIRAATEVDALVVEVEDQGPGITAIPPLPDLSRKIAGIEKATGWGIYLMRSYASEVTYIVGTGSGCTVRLRFAKSSPATPVEPGIVTKSRINGSETEARNGA